MSNSRLRHWLAGLVALALSCSSNLFAQQEGGDKGPAGESSVVGAAQKMAMRMQEQVRDIQTLLTKAEADRSEGRFSDAYVAYATALKSTPNVPATAELRRTIFSRYQLGAMDFAKQLGGVGQIDDAEAVMNRVLADARDLQLDPSDITQGFRTLLGQLRDPEHFSPANTAMHQRNVENVSSWLINAEGAIRLADYDKAHDYYIRVLNADPYNEAAARGLELVNRKIIDYQASARDQTRATFTRQIEAQWETEVPPQLGVGNVPDSAAAYRQDSSSAGLAIAEKLSRIIVPTVQFEGAPLRDVLEYLAQRAAELDTMERDPARRGLNIVIDSSAAGGEDVGARPVTIKLSQVPLDAVLRYVTSQAQLKYRVDPFAVTVVPLSVSDDAVLMTQSFMVPPDFISSDGGGGAAAGPIDPFATTAPAGTGTTLVKRITAEVFLKAQGVEFPPGSSATYIPSTNMLVMRNTPDAVDFVRSLVEATRSQGEKMVEVTFRMISVGQIDLKENGFDWLLAPFNVDSGASTFASGGTTGNQGGRTAGDFPFGGIGGNPITAGLRSGDVRTQLSIDDVLSRTTASPPSSVAPGVFGFSGVFSDPVFQTVWRNLDQAKGVDRLCESSVLVKPGQTASVRAVREFIYPTEYDPPEVPNNIAGTTTITFDPLGNIIAIDEGNGFAVTPANPTAFEMREVGKVLEVQPLVGPDNQTVDLTVTADLSDFIGFINYGTPINQVFSVPGLLVPTTASVEVTPNRILQPVFEAVKETTNVSVYDGQTIVIGGLVGDSAVDVEDQVPLLGDLPLVGRLFQSSVEDRTARAILLFVGVRIVDPAGVPINQRIASLESP